MFLKMALEQVEEYKRYVQYLKNRTEILSEFTIAPLEIDGIVLDDKKEDEINRIANKLKKVSYLLKEITRELDKKI